MRILRALAIFKFAFARALSYLRPCYLCPLPKVASRAQNRCFAPYLRPSVYALEETRLATVSVPESDFFSATNKKKVPHLFNGNSEKFLWNFLARTVVTKTQYTFNRFHIGVVSPTSEEIGDTRSTSDEIADVTSTSDDVTGISRYISKTSNL